MAPPPRGIIASLLGTSLLLSTLAPSAQAEGAGGVLAEPGKTVRTPAQAGGAEYGSALRRLPGRPRVRVLRLEHRHVIVGSRARLLIDVRRRQARTARVRVTIDPRRGRTRHLAVRRVRAGETTRLRLPQLRRGRYSVRVAVLAGKGEQPLPAHTLTLTVRSKPRRPAIPVLPPATPQQHTAPAVVGGGVFPVRGPHTLGGADAGFGAGRIGHLHEGHDIAAASGTPVVAPLAGEVLFNDYQHGGAGRYVILHADNGWEMMFAHLLAGSATLAPGTRVTAGQQIGLVGSTGGSTGPHLHFELWPDGWREIKRTRPVDPLPQLRAWGG
jgi:murein DD-endopeptidase MepM/ murein hydrolase activator NlpD